MKALFQNAPPFLVPTLLLIFIIGLAYVWGHAGTMISTDNQFSSGDIYSSKLTPVPNDSDHLQMTLKLTQSGLNKLKVFRGSGSSSVPIAYEGKSLGMLPPSADSATFVLIMPQKQAVAAKLAIGR